MQLSKADKLARDLLDAYGLISWTFAFDRSKKRFGICFHHLKMIRLSRHLTVLNDEQTVTSTLKHEIAHALVGVGHGHDKVWRRKAIELGHSGNRCYDSKVVKTPEGKFRGECPGCKRTISRHARRNIACGKCCNSKNGGKFSSEFCFVWTKT